MNKFITVFVVILAILVVGILYLINGIFSYSFPDIKEIPKEYPKSVEAKGENWNIPENPEGKG